MNMYINDLANFHGFQLASERESRSTSSTMGMCSTRNRNSIEFQPGWGPQITKTLQVMWGNLPTRSVHIQTQYHTFFFRYFKEVISLCLDTRLFAFASGSYLASFEIRQEIHELMLVNSRRGCKVVRLKCPELSAPFLTATAEGLCSWGGDPFIFGRGGEDSGLSLLLGGVGSPIRRHPNTSKYIKYMGVQISSNFRGGLTPGNLNPHSNIMLELLVILAHY